MQLSVDHRIATNKIERKRLEDLGCVIAPIDASGDSPGFPSSSQERLFHKQKRACRPAHAPKRH